MGIIYRTREELEQLILDEIHNWSLATVAKLTNKLREQLLSYTYETVSWRRALPKLSRDALCDLARELTSNGSLLMGIVLVRALKLQPDDDFALVVQGESRPYALAYCEKCRQYPSEYVCRPAIGQSAGGEVGVLMRSGRDRDTD